MTTTCVTLGCIAPAGRVGCVRRHLLPLLLAVGFIAAGGNLQAEGESAAPTQEQIDAFQARADAAIKSGEQAKLRELYYFEGTPEDYQRQALERWKLYNKYGVFDKTHFVPMEQIKAQWNSRLIDSFLGKQDVNGMTIGKNLEPVGVLKAEFKLKKSQGKNSHMMAVGLTPEGELRIAGDRVEGEPVIKAGTTAPPAFTAKPVTPVMVDAFKQRIRQAYKKGDWRDVATLTDYRGATQVTINQEVMGLSRMAKPEEFTDGELVFTPLAELSETNQPNMFQTLVMKDGIPAGMRPNLPIVGTLQIKMENSGSWTATRPVAQDENGKLVFPSFVLDGDAD